jgi:hypothetical protein
MNSYGLRPYKPPIFLLIFLNGLNRSVSLDFGKMTIQKVQLQSLRFWLACCRGIAAKSSQEKEISGFLNERSLVVSLAFNNPSDSNRICRQFSLS